MAQNLENKGNRRSTQICERRLFLVSGHTHTLADCFCLLSQPGHVSMHVVAAYFFNCQLARPVIGLAPTNALCEVYSRSSTAVLDLRLSARKHAQLPAELIVQVEITQQYIPVLVRVALRPVVKMRGA